MEHFNKSVPEGIKNKLASLVESLELSDITYNLENQNKSEINEIVGFSYDGFWAFQQGGYSFDTFFLFNCDSSYHFSEKQTMFYHSLQIACQEAYYHEFESQCFDTEEYYNYEDEYLADLSCLLSVRMYCKNGQVMFDISINYRDEYHREKHNEYLIEFQYSFDEFLSLDNKDIISQLKLK